MTNRMTEPMTNMMPHPTVVIGAGLAGLAAARQLRAAGRSVVVLEKSRGLGGRLNTRRHLGTRADRGVPFLERQGPLTTAWLAEVEQPCNLRPWPGQLHQLTASGIEVTTPADRFAIPAGLSSAAKVWAEGLLIVRGHRAIRLIAPAQAGDPWEIQCDFPTAIDPAEQRDSWLASAIVLAIPAPQAAELLDPIAPDWAATARRVAFDPCFSVTAAYGAERSLTAPGLESWQAIRTDVAPDWRWLSREDSKSDKSDDGDQPVVLLHSSPALADRLWDAPDLAAVGQGLLDRAGADTGLDLSQPAWLQVHRWRYAIVRNPLTINAFVDPSRAIAVAGDWCAPHGAGRSLEAALQSGQAAAAGLLSPI